MIRRRSWMKNQIEKLKTFGTSVFNRCFSPGGNPRPKRRGHRQVVKCQMAEVDRLEDRTCLSVNIQFWYDPNDPFFMNHPERQQILGIAGEIIGERVSTQLNAIRPSGSNQWNAIYEDPLTGNQKVCYNFSIPANTMWVFVGARDLPGISKGFGGPGGVYSEGTSVWNDNVKHRGTRLRNNISTPWGGSISFDNRTNWYFGLDPAGLNGTQTDFLSMAVHELGHVFGIEGHFPEGTRSDGVETAMDPTINPGTRKMFTSADWNALQNIGWQVGPRNFLVAARATYNGHPAPGIFSIQASNRVQVGGIESRYGVQTVAARSFDVRRIDHPEFDDSWDFVLRLYDDESGTLTELGSENKGTRHLSPLPHKILFLEFDVGPTVLRLSGGARVAEDEPQFVQVTGDPGNSNDEIRVFNLFLRNFISVNGEADSIPLRTSRVNLDGGLGDDYFQLGSANQFQGSNVHYSGGAGNDRFEIQGGNYQNVIVRLTGPGHGRIELDGIGYDFDSLELLEIIPNLLGSIRNLTLDLSDNEAHRVILEDFGPPNDPNQLMRLRIDGGLTDLIFRSPSDRLSILTRDGYDIVEPNSLDPVFDGQLQVDLGTGQESLVVTGADAGAGAHVRVWDARRRAEKFGLFPYGHQFGGGVRVAVGDVNGDGTPDIITSPGTGGGPHVRIINGRDGSHIRDIFPYSHQFMGGVYIAAADVNEDGFDDIITGPGTGGGPHVRIYSGRDGALIRDLHPYAPGFTGGVRVATGDVNNDGTLDIITSPGPGGGPHVRSYSGRDNSHIRDFVAYHPDFTGGVFIASGDFNNDGYADIVTSPDAGGGPHVKILSGRDGSLLQEFNAYHPNFSGGVRVAVGNDNGDRIPDIITSPGPTGGPHVRLIAGSSRGTSSIDFLAYPGFFGGVFVAGDTSSFAQLLELNSAGYQNSSETNSIVDDDPSQVSHIVLGALPSQNNASNPIPPTNLVQREQEFSNFDAWVSTNKEEDPIPSNDAQVIDVESSPLRSEIDLLESLDAVFEDNFFPDLLLASIS